MYFLYYQLSYIIFVISSFSQTTLIGVSHSLYGTALLVGFSRHNKVSSAFFRLSKGKSFLLNFLE